MPGRTHRREFKIEAAKLATERGVPVPQACRDLELAESGLRRGMREAAMSPTSAFPGRGRQRTEPAEIAALKKELAELKAGRSPWPQRLRRDRRRGARRDALPAAAWV